MILCFYGRETIYLPCNSTLFSKVMESNIQVSCLGLEYEFVYLKRQHGWDRCLHPNLTQTNLIQSLALQVS